MRAAIFHGPGDIRVEERPDPTIQSSTDAIVQVMRSCVCGSDLWYYRGIADFPVGAGIGHEFIGEVLAVGDDVKSVSVGDWVVAPFAFSCGECEFCRAGLQTSCVVGGYWGKTNNGGQAELVRVPFAGSTLVRLPEEVAFDADLQTNMLTLSDVMSTGHHANVLAKTAPNSTVVVIGDGAVGLCAVLAARRIGAEKIVAVGRHDSRLKLAEQFGATHLIKDDGESTVGAVRDVTSGGSQSVCECVGSGASIDLAIAVARDGGTVGAVGMPRTITDSIDYSGLFERNVGLHFGVAPARQYIPELMQSVLEGQINPSPVFDYTVNLHDIADGYKAMDERVAIKTLVVP